MENKSFKYYAFISYCTEDEKWAKWLHRHLENYHIPSRLCSEYPALPKKIRPVFWYKVDLSGAKLKSSLEKELEASNYLIVICSPHSAKSDWVNDEIMSFTKSHGDDKIIPLIVAGEPKSDNPSTECLPPVLRNLDRNDEIRGISIPELGKYHALVDVVATMFNVRFDSLWQRHRRRRIRNRIICSLLALAAICVGVFAFDYFRTSRQYFTNYEFCYGIPTGIDRLKKSDLKTAINHYVFELSRGKLRRVYRANPYGHPIDEGSSWSQFRTAILDMGYEGDRLSSITFSDANSNPQFKFVYSDDFRRADIKDIESGDAASLFKSSSSTFENMTGKGNFDLNGVFLNTKSQVARYVYDYDPDGYISRIHFKRYNGSNETGYDDNGICGIEYERDASHRITKKRYLGENGEYMADKMGVAGFEYGYNEHGDLNYERCYDIDGNNQLCDMGYAISHINYDYPERRCTETHFGINEQPVMTLANYHKGVFEVKNDTIVSTYFDTELQPTYMSFPMRGYGLFHKSKLTFDKKGNPVEYTYFGTDGEPCYDIMRVHKVVVEYDDKGRFVKSTSFNTAGEYQPNIFGVAESHISYLNDGNNPHSIEYYRRPGFRTNILNLSKRVFSYSGNRIVKSVCYDSNDMPSFPAVNLGAHIVNLDYDDFGNVSDLWLKDASGTTQYFPDSFASHAKATYQNGNCVKLEFFNKKGRPAMMANGYSTMLMEYDKRGRRTAIEYLDTLGNPVIVPVLQYARIESEFDMQGHEIETRTYDHNHRPIICSDGWAVKKQEFKDNLVTRVSSFGVKGEPTLANYIEAHVKELKYDPSRRVISERYYGLNNEPILTGYGVNEVRYKYNNHGLPVEISSYDTNGRPVNSTQNFHKKINEYDSRNNIIAERYFDTSGNPVVNKNFGYAYAESEFNPAGQLLSTRAYGKDSQPVNNNNGVHMILNKYNKFGDQILWAFLDKNNEPVSTFCNNDYFAILYNIFDENSTFRGYVYYGNYFVEYKAGVPLIEDGKERGVLWRDDFLTMRMRLPDGTEREFSRFSDSPYEREYAALLDSVSENTLIEVKRLIEYKE